MGKFEEIIEDINIDDIKIGINLASGLIAAGIEILKLLEKDNNLSNIDLLAIIEKQNTALESAKKDHLEAINNAGET